MGKLAFGKFRKMWSALATSESSTHSLPIYCLLLEQFQPYHLAGFRHSLVISIVETTNSWGDKVPETWLEPEVKEDSSSEDMLDQKRFVGCEAPSLSLISLIH